MKIIFLLKFLPKGIGVSWFAANVYQNYFQLNRIIGNNQNGQNFNLEGNERYIYGRALFVGKLNHHE
jgi:hypothetical protein